MSLLCAPILISVLLNGVLLHLSLPQLLTFSFDPKQNASLAGSDVCVCVCVCVRVFAILFQAGSEIKTLVWQVVMCVCVCVCVCVCHSVPSRV